jgi:hypothetical protein
MASLSFTLSADDAALFAALQGKALLPSLAVPGKGELVQLYKEKKRDEEFKIIEPYADLLETELKRILEQRKESVLTQLRESKNSTFTVDLFSWTTVHYYESLSDMQRRVSEMTPEEVERHNWQRTSRQRRIEENGWESTFGVMTHSSVYGYEADEAWHSYYPKKVDRIFRNSDLAWRLSLALGPNFFPSYRWDLVEDAGDTSDFGFSVYKKTLYVRYYPFGVSKAQMTKLLAVAKKDAERISKDEKAAFGSEEFSVGGIESLCVLPQPEDDYAGMPPLVAASKFKWSGVGYAEDKEGRASRFSRGDRCFCGCDEDASE